MQQYELEAWPGDHDLTDDQVTELLQQANDIEARYPDPDDQDERDAALVAAFSLMTEDKDEILGNYGHQLAVARRSEARALAALRHAATVLVPAGDATESGFANKAGVDRMAVRRWLGKR